MLYLFIWFAIKVDYMGFEEFFNNNFVTPLGQYYTPVNTIIYGIIFALAVFGVYKLLKRLNIPIDRNFLVGIVPFVVLGSVLRVLRDAKLLDYWIFASPIIYMLMFVIAAVALLLSKYIERFVKNKKGKLADFLSSYHRLWCTIGIVLVVAAFILLLTTGFKNYYGAGLMLGVAAIFGVIVYLLYDAQIKFGDRYPMLKVYSKENSILLGIHLFDASTTFVALTFFPYYEQHVVSNIVIGFLGPAGQFLLKFIVVTIVLWALDNNLKIDTESIYMRNFIKIAIFILGFAPGFRNFLRLGFGV